MSTPHFERIHHLNLVARRTELRSFMIDGEIKHRGSSSISQVDKSILIPPVSRISLNAGLLAIQLDNGEMMTKHTFYKGALRNGVFIADDITEIRDGSRTEILVRIPLIENMAVWQVMSNARGTGRFNLDVLLLKNS